MIVRTFFVRTSYDGLSKKEVVMKTELEQVVLLGRSVADWEKELGKKATAEGFGAFSQEVRRRILLRHASSGVLILDFASVWIDDATTIEKGAIIFPNNHLLGACKLGKCTLMPFNVLEDATVGEGTVVRASQLVGAVVGKDCSVGPFAFLRPKTRVEDGCRIGDFVELKSSRIGAGSKVAHLTYIGDATVGKKCNFGCGAVVANYDGVNKSHTSVGDGCFIGCNSNLVAPLSLGDGCFVAAGTTVTRNVEGGKLVIGRVRQEERNWNGISGRMESEDSSGKN